MWLRNNYVRTLTGISIVAILLIMLLPENSSADGSNDSDARSQPQTIPAPPVLPHPPLASRPHQPRLLQVAASNESARYHPYQTPSKVPTPSYAASVRGGLPSGTWTNETPMGRVEMTIKGNKISIDVEGSGEFALVSPSLCGEYSVASDGTIFGLIHSVDLGLSSVAAQEMGEEYLFLSGLSDIPFSMRAYSETEKLAIKQVTFGIPMQVMMATDGEVGEISLYAQSMLTGQYESSN